MAASSGNVKITPLGSHDGEFCRRDRAMLFEDPDGTRIVYDVGRTVAGPDDPRLGKINVVLLSSVHGDHLGDKAIPSVNAGTCAKPKAVIPQHMNEEATQGGELQPGTKTAKFKSLIKGIPVHIPLSGRTMEFDGDARCVKGC